MKEAYIALVSAANQVETDYEKYKTDSYFSYVYANKRNILAKAAESLKVSGNIKAQN